MSVWVFGACPSPLLMRVFLYQFSISLAETPPIFSTIVNRVWRGFSRAIHGLCNVLGSSPAAASRQKTCLSWIWSSGNHSVFPEAQILRFAQTICRDWSWPGLSLQRRGEIFRVGLYDMDYNVFHGLIRGIDGNGIISLYVNFIF